MTKPADVGAGSTDAVAAGTADTHSLQDLLELQQAAFLRDGIPDADTRIDRINRLASLILDHSDELTVALNADFGTRPRELSVATDISGCMYDLVHQRRHVAAWMRTQKVGALARLGVKQWIRHDPKGVVGVMGPWNFPLQLTIVPAGAAFAAGNRVLMRPSSVTRRTTEVLARYAPDYFSLEEFAVATSAHGSGSDFAKLKVDHMFFTGSPEVGASVAGEAAKNLVPVTLELGGKNPVVVDTDTDVREAANRVADTRMINGGQVCLCPDYVFVPEDKLTEFTDTVIERWRTNYPTIVDNPQFTSTVNEKNYQRIVGLIEDAEQLGATARQVVPAGESLPNAAERKIAPTLLTGVKAGMKIEEDEVFGPVLTVYPYRELSEAIGHINAHGHPLALYWYGDDNERFHRLQDSTRSGAVCGNDFALHLLTGDLPFGGIGRSGMGNYHGKFGFETFSHDRAVFLSTAPLTLSRLMSAPFTRTDTRLTNGQLAGFRKLNDRAKRRLAKRR
ncbi:aldehyde dehydrogenase family protein [Williamsia sterculiae]|uniref:Aldehyde dehydrogenase n=1 Tax=Williamsia sterculiae TaxID=1344003 RepID=A0A1N7CRZ0_9NOCA|nr:aldehyde dehydrogenase family protein [Williamsia sterculiae]SIR66353.1 coniferyl-aldehyde dehydrogenase [Williamsia sterculiae]